MSTAGDGLAQIVLSTFNGERYLGPLLDSLLAQDHSPFEILARDDGSTDGTLELLRSYAARTPGLRVVPGRHLGFVRSFAAALELTSPAADYVALCDQDDVWRPEKLSRAVARLRHVPQGTPALYCSRLAVVDERLAPLGLSPLPRKGLSFRNALVESQSVGCTSVLNRSASEVLGTFPSEVVSHDWWIYLVVSAFGETIYDEEPTILFREHPGNVFGIKLEWADTWQTKIRQFLQPGNAHLALKQAEAFHRLHAVALSDDKLRLLERFVTSQSRFRTRLRYAASPEVYRQSARDHFLLKAKIALGRV